MKPIIGYARVSTEEQADTKALEQQKNRLSEAGAERIYCDIESGCNPEREQLKKVLDLVVQQEVSTVIATRWDRISRNSQLYENIKRIFRDSGVKLRLLDQGEIDLKTAAGELSSDLQVLFSVHESRMLRERVKKGFEYRRSRNVAWTRPPWGYLIINDKYELDQVIIPYCLLIHRPNNYLTLADEPDDSQLLIWQSRAKLARELFDYFLQVRKPTKLLRYLQDNYGLQKNQDLIFPALKNFPTSSRGIKQWLQNPVFQGHTAYQKYKKDGGVKTPDEWDIRRDTHPAHRLVTEEEAQEIQAILAANRKQFGQLNATFYLTGNIFCKACKSKCGLKRGGGYAYYGCQHSATVCRNRKVVRISKIEQAIINKLVQRAWEFHQLPQEAMKSSKLVELERQYEALDKIPGSDFTSTLKDAKAKLLQEIELERSQTDNLATKMLGHSSARKINFWYSLNQEEREIFYNQLLERVVLLDGEVTEVALKV
ncbi:MAG: recombinase family protein [Microcoleus sp. SIO2G3]|nr:recombinase family protein [Microcoleus sp. SIO2G3]